MKALLSCLIVVVFSLSLNAEKIKVVILADQSYPPYSFVEKGKLTGVYTDIIRKASESLDGYDVQLKAVPWKRGLKLLEKGKEFALYPPYLRPEMRPYLKPYSMAILEEKNVVVSTEAFVAKYPNAKWPDTFKGMKIGRNAGFAVGDEEKKNGFLKVEDAKSSTLNLKKLGLGRIDGYINDEISIYWSLKKAQKSGEYKKSYPKLSTAAVLKVETGHIGYSRDYKASWKEDFIAQMDKALQALKDSGELQRILESYK